MSNIVNYSITSDFGGTFNTHQFENEIINSTITTILTSINRNGDDIIITFDSIPSGPELTELASLKDNYVYKKNPEILNNLTNAAFGTSTTLVYEQTIDRLISVPDTTDTLVCKNTTDILTNKDLTDGTNTFALDATDITSGTFDPVRIGATGVTQHVGSLVHQNLSGAGTNTHGDIDNHISNTAIHETITASNIGTTGVGVFKQKAGVDLQFKSLVQGTNITLSSDANAVTINSTVGMNWQGTWVSQNYAVDDAVEYNGSAYICKLNTVSNEVPSNTTYWDVFSSKGIQGMVWLGTWSGGTSYVINDTIEYNGSSYICILGHTNFVPPNGTYWNLVVSKGPTGSSTSGIFGSEYKYGEDPTESSTTSTSWKEKIKLETGIIPAGVYRIGVYYNWGFSDTGGNFKGRVQIDDSIEILTHDQEPKQKTEFTQYQNHVLSGFKHINLSNGSHYIDVDYGSGKSGEMAHISNVRIEFWRIS